MRLIALDQKRRLITIQFPYDEGIKAIVRTVPGRRWDRDARVWTVPLAQAQRVVNSLASRGFAIAEEVRTLVEWVPDAAREERAQAPESGFVSGRGQQGGTGLEAASGGGQRAQRPHVINGPRGRQERGATYSVSQLNATLRRAVRNALPRAVWLTGELVGFDRGGRSGHRFFEIVEKGDHGALARIPTVLWADDAPIVAHRLRTADEPFELADGVVVRVLVDVDVYTRGGRLQAIVRDIDPIFTLGELAMRREAILRTLREEGLADRNKVLPFPPVPLRVALLTSRDGEAARDFLHELARSGLGFAVDVFDIVSQGPRLSGSVCDKLAQAVAHSEAAECRDEPGYDVVVITRGGGSRTDLGWFDDLAVARKVASCPLKVVVAIGHQRDRSALDDLALSAKTPTAAASLLAERVAGYLMRQEELWAAMHARAARLLTHQRERLGNAGHRLAATSIARSARARATLEVAPEQLLRASIQRLRQVERRLQADTQTISAAAKHALRHDRQTVSQQLRRLLQSPALPRLTAQLAVLDRASSRLERGVSRSLSSAQRRLEHANERLHWRDPQRVLERGFVRVRDEEGHVVTDGANVRAGDRLRLEWSRRAADVEVVGIEERPEDSDASRFPDTDGAS